MNKMSSPNSWHIESACDAILVVDATGAVMARLIINDATPEALALDMAAKLIASAQRLEALASGE